MTLQLAHVAMWNWGLDFENRDHEFLVRVGILSHLRSQFSLLVREQQEQKEQQEDDDTENHSSSSWIPWSFDYVKQALLTGELTKRGLLTHMRGAPRSLVSSEWFARKGLFVKDAKQSYDNIESLSNLYARFLRYYVDMYAKQQAIFRKRRTKKEGKAEHDPLDKTNRLMRLSQLQFSSWTLFQVIATMCIGGAEGRRDEEFELRQRLANSAGVRNMFEHEVREYHFYYLTQSLVSLDTITRITRYNHSHHVTRRINTYNYRYRLHLRNQSL